MMKDGQKFISFLAQSIWFGIILIAFLPLLTYQYSLFPYVFPRTIAFRIIIEILLGLYGMLILFSSGYLPKISYILGCSAIFLLAISLSSVFGENLYNSFWSTIERSEGIITWIHFFGFLLLLSGMIRAKEEWQKFFFAIIIAGWVQSAYSLFQIFGAPYILKTSGERIGGSIGNPSFLATYLLFIIFISALYVFQAATKAHKLIALFLIVADSVIILFTQTRGAIFTLFGAGFLFLCMYLVRQRKKKTLIISAGIIAIFLLASSILYSAKDTAAIQNVGFLQRIFSTSIKDISLQNRLIVWGVGWKGFLARPLLGWGWENFQIPFNIYVNPIIARDIGSQPWYDRAHNVVVEIAVTSGVLGIVSYLLIFAAVFFGIRKIRVSKLLSPISRDILTVLFLSYFLQNLFVFDTFNSYLMFFTMLAYLNFLCSKTVEPKDMPAFQRFSPKIIIALIAIAVGASIYYFNARPALANWFVVRAVTKNKTEPIKMLASFRKAFWFSPPNAQELRYILIQYARDQITLRGITPQTIPLSLFAISEMKKSVIASPYFIQNSILLSELYLSLASYDISYLDDAEEISLAALERAPYRYQIYFVLGRIKMSQGKFREGIDYFKKAVELNDAFAEAHWNLAVAYILSKDDTRAVFEELKNARSRVFDAYTPANIKKLLNAYSDSKNLLGARQFLQKLIEQFPQMKEYQEMLNSLSPQSN